MIDMKRLSLFGLIAAVLAFPRVATAQSAPCPDDFFYAFLFPASQTITPGATASMGVATPFPPFCTDFSWIQGRKGSPGTVVLFGQGKAGYTTPPLTTTQIYWVHAVYFPFPTGDPSVADSNMVTITVLAPANIITQPKSQHIKQDTTATLNVDAIGPDPQSYQWYSGPSGDTSSPIGGATSSSYTTPPFSTAANYWVRVSNPYGTTDSSTATILILLPSGDFDGDGRTDVGVFRPSTGGWYVLQSSTGNTSSVGYSWGLSTDVPQPGDYDGDGKTDPTVFRPSTGGWYVLKSSTNYTTSFGVFWGLSTDVPMPGDYDGDGRTDPAIYRPSTGLWAMLKSSVNYASAMYVSWGLSTDQPMPGDYDGDGKVDPAVYRPSTGGWYVLKSSTSFTTSFGVSWGLSTDVPVPGDYDGDGKVDPAIFRPSLWAVLQSSTGYSSAIYLNLGASTDVAAPADYDGDGQTDPAVFRPSTGEWSVLKSSIGYAPVFKVSWGLSTDTPMNKRQ